MRPAGLLWGMLVGRSDALRQSKTLRAARATRFIPLCADPTVRKRLCAAAARFKYEVRMSADIILADFKTKTFHKPDPITLERLAAEIMSQVEGGSTVVAPYGGAGIDGMGLEKSE